MSKKSLCLAVSDPWSCTSEVDQSQERSEKVREWLFPLHIMMVEPFGGLDARIKWGMSDNVLLLRDRRAAELRSVRRLNEQTFSEQV